VLGEVDVLVKAPARMTSSGYADLLGKVTAGGDWIISEVLGIEQIPPKVWSLVQDPLREWTGRPSEVAGGDRDAMDKLTEGLIMSGLAMQSYQSSRPASGSEHQFSHLWEGEGLGRDQDPPLSHGFKVGVGSISMAAFYERVLERDLGSIDVDAICGAWPPWEEMERRVREAYSGSRLEDAAVGETRAKYIDAGVLRERLELLRGQWPSLRERLEGQLVPASELQEMLEAAGCPVSPGGIGLGWDQFEATYARAQMLRSRYTVLDLALETGIFDECVAELFAPGGFWAPETARRES
jgi:glycerol-1-phosphate dehydrogenase [NAD(P)+]